MIIQGQFTIVDLNDGKNGTGVKKIDTHIREFTTSLWQTYGEIGHNEYWTAPSSTYNNTHISVGDTAYVVGIVTDAFSSNGKNISAAIYGVVTEITSSGIRMTTTNLLMGSAGQDGTGIISSKAMYYLSSSNTQLKDGSWQESAPAWKSGYYYWQKIVTTYTSGSPTESAAVCISGEKGLDGQGVESIEPEYTLSDNSDKLDGNENWQKSMPEYTQGYYLWVRNKIKYTNQTNPVYTEAYCDTSWNVLNNLSTNNLIRNSNFSNGLKYWTGTMNYEYSNSEDVKQPYVLITNKSTTADVDGIKTFHTDKEDNYVHEMGTKYSISFLAKSGTNGTALKVSVGETNIDNNLITSVNLTTSWEAYTATYTANVSDSLNFTLPVLNSSCYITNIYLVKGSVIGDWQIAQEDIQESFDKIGSDIDGMNSDLKEEIKNSYDKIVNEELQNYTSQTDFSDVKAKFEGITSTVDGLKLNFEAFDKKTENKFADIEKHISFEDGNITLGVTDDSNDETEYISLKLTHTEMAFWQNSQRLAYFSNNSLYVPLSLTLGNFAFIPRANGSLDFKKVGNK